MAESVKIAQVGDIPEGRGQVVEVQGRTIALFNVNGEFFAIQNTCPHRGAPLGEGALEGTVVTCPWHGWQFDVTTGASPVNPAARQDTYPVTVAGDDLRVELED